MSSSGLLLFLQGGAVRYVDGMRQIRLSFWFETESTYAACRAKYNDSKVVRVTNS